MNNHRRHSQRGMTLMIVALLLVCFMGIAALCVDLGVLYTARTSAQHAADAAALAGAYTFLNPAANQPTAAQNAAVAVGNTNTVLGQSPGIAAGNVTVDTAGRNVIVTVTETANTFFAKVLPGVNKATISVSAKAHASAVGAATRCIKPVYIPNTLLSPLGQQGCTTNPPQVIFDSSGNVTPFAQNLMDQCTLIRPTTPQDVTKGGFSAGQFFSLDFGTGANTYRCVWSSCLNNAACGADQSLVACGDSYPVKTGDMVGPTKQGVGDLTTPTDTWIGPGEYQSALGIVDTSKQVSVVPVWDNCSQPINSGTNGQQAKVIGFLQMFVDGMTGQNGCSAKGGGGGGGNGSWVKIHPIDPIACGNGGGGGNPPSTGPFAVPVQLVQYP